MRLNLLYLTTLCAALAGLADAGNYMFDESCNATPGMLAFVRATFTNAIAMSQAAYAAVQAPMNQGVTDTLNRLVTTTGGAATPAQWAAQVFGPQGINRFTTEILVQDNNLLGTNDVKIYCDQTRLQQREDTRWVDTDTMREDVERINCKARNSIVNPTDFALMYTTWNPERRDGEGNIVSGESFHQIQICPFFLLWALPLGSNLNTVLLPKILWKKMSIGLAQQILTKTKYTPIDGLSLFDKVILHELTHATTNPTYATVDTPTNDGPAYGWKLCTALSAFSTAVLNADTWALFGSIAWQIQEGLITGVNADGTVNKP